MTNICVQPISDHYTNTFYPILHNQHIEKSDDQMKLCMYIYIFTVDLLS